MIIGIWLWNITEFMSVVYDLTADIIILDFKNKFSEGLFNKLFDVPKI